MTEAALTAKIIRRLNELPSTFAFKSKGDPRQRRGLPDIIGCHVGLFFGFEVKLPGKERNVTQLQQQTLDDITEADGLGRVITSAAQAVELLREWEMS